MINLLIYNNDNEYCKILVNQLNKINQNIRICYIFTTINEISNVDNLSEIDICIFYIKNNYEKELLSSIEKISRYKTLILILENKNVIPFLNDKISYILKTKNINHDIISINKIINEKNNKSGVKLKIKKELNFLGYNDKYVGTTYLIEAIYLLYTNFHTINVTLEKDVYPIIAKKI